MGRPSELLPGYRPECGGVVLPAEGYGNRLLLGCVAEKFQKTAIACGAESRLSIKQCSDVRI